MKNPQPNPLLRIIRAAMDTPVDGKGNARSIKSVADSSGVAYACTHGIVNATESRVADNVMAVLRTVAPDVADYLDETAASMEGDARYLGGAVGAPKKARAN